MAISLKTVLVTGGASGIGRAFVERLSKQAQCAFRWAMWHGSILKKKNTFEDLQCKSIYWNLLVETLIRARQNRSRPRQHRSIDHSNIAAGRTAGAGLSDNRFSPFNLLFAWPEYVVCKRYLLWVNA